MSAQHNRFIVTGGGGFVGKALALRLRSLGAEVISVSRGNYPELTALGIKHQRVDLTQDFMGLVQVFKGADAVFHVASKTDMWGPYEDFFKSNVLATQNMIEACKLADVNKLIYTSSPSVVAGGEDLNGVNESYPYPKEHLAYYPMTKARAEQEVLAANSNDLYTIALRPHLIFGPGDNHLVPEILARAKAGKLVRVGSREIMTDLTFIDDCVEAHLLAYKALDRASARGRAYFISQGEPVSLWGWINKVLELNQLSPVTRSIPQWLAETLSGPSELLGKIAGSRPLLTKFLVCEMSTNHYFDISAAKKELGYQPSCNIAEALHRTFGKKTSGAVVLEQAAT